MVPLPSQNIVGVCNQITLLILYYISSRVVTLLTVTDAPKRLRWSRGSVLAFGTQARGFAPIRSRRIFRAKKSSARLPSEGK
jgi:hypothetical protein